MRITMLVSRYVLRLQVKHVVATGQLPAAAETGAVIQHLFIGTEFDLRSQAKAVLTG